MATNCPLAGRLLFFSFFSASILLTGYKAATAQGAPPPAVTVTPVVSREVTATGDFIGRVVAIDKVDVVARVSGFINERNFTEGQQVKTGDLLFSIEPDTYKAAVDQQNANLAKAKATEVNANLQLQRGQDLVRNQNIPQSEVDQRAANAQAAHADVLQGLARTSKDQSRLHGNPLPDRRTDWTCEFHYGQSCQPIIRHLGDDRQSRPYLCYISGQRGRRNRI